jgi:prepilin-type N-terminal cleavage/methylation domain-containing protein
MKPEFRAGFTIIELMMVVTIIAIFAAVAAPSVIEVTQRGKLTGMTDKIEMAASAARTLAMQTNRAAVLEINGTQLWINQLQTSDCGSPILKRCVQNMGSAKDSANTNIIVVNGGSYGEAGVNICSIRVALVDSSNKCVPTDVSGNKIRICYAGNGDLMVDIKNGGDAATTCSSTSAVSAPKWQRTCAAWAGQGASPAASLRFSGVQIFLNRFKSGSGTCKVGAALSSDALDVTREVQLPSGGHPTSRSK